jgi:hypothetical protein
VSLRRRFLILGGEEDTVKAMGSRVVVSEVVLGIIDMGFNKITENLLKRMLIQIF